MSYSDFSLNLPSDAQSYDHIKTISLGKIGGGEKEVLLKDYLEVATSRTFFGRLWSQYKLKKAGKGEVTSDSLKLVDWNTLEKISGSCKGLLEAIEMEKWQKPNLNPRAIGGEEGKSIKELKSEWNAKLKQLDKLKEKLTGIDQRVVKEGKRRDKRVGELLSPIKKMPAPALLKNPRLQHHFNNYIEGLYRRDVEDSGASSSLHQMHKAISNAENLVAMHKHAGIKMDQEMEDIYSGNLESRQLNLIKDGFVEYLLENVSEEKFSEIELLDIEIALNQLNGKPEKAKGLAKEQKRALFEGLQRLTTDVGRKETLKNPVLSRAYEEFVEKIEDNLDEIIVFRKEEPRKKQQEDDVILEMLGGEEPAGRARTTDYPYFLDFMHHLASKRVGGELGTELQNAFDQLYRLGPLKAETIDEDRETERVLAKLEPYISNEIGRAEMMRYPNLKREYVRFKAHTFDEIDSSRGIDKDSASSIRHFQWNTQFPFMREFAAYLAEQKALGLLNGKVSGDLDRLLGEGEESYQDLNW